jgi:hypothetical protein
MYCALNRQIWDTSWLIISAKEDDFFGITGKDKLIRSRLRQLFNQEWADAAI